jgi:hypothetical protein
VKLVRVNRGDNGEFWAWRFWCPGCQDDHMVDARWAFNGNAERPTFTPSVLVRSGHFNEGHKEGESCWCTYNAEHPGATAPFACYRCHSYVTDGRIQFLSDCTHGLAGQTVDLPDFPDRDI